MKEKIEHLHVAVAALKVAALKVPDFLSLTQSTLQILPVREIGLGRSRWPGSCSCIAFAVQHLEVVHINHGVIGLAFLEFKYLISQSTRLETTLCLRLTRRALFLEAMRACCLAALL